MKRRAALAPMLAVLLSGHLARAADEPTTMPTSQPALLDVSDKQAIDANIDKDVLVVGTVVDAKWSASGAVFLIKFKEGQSTQFQCALFSKTRRTMETAFGGDLADAFAGSKIRVAGKLQSYRNRPEIVISDPKQVTILERGPGRSPGADAATRPATGG